MDFLTKKHKPNNGEVPQYYVEGNHPAIISPEVFEMVQREMEKRTDNKNGRYSGVDRFSAKIRCGQCGGYYGAKVWHSNDKYRKVVYQCNRKFKNADKCTTPHFDEQQIEQIFIKAANKLLVEKEEIIDNLQTIQATICDTSALETEQKNLAEEMNMLAEIIQNMVAENARISQNQADYQSRYDEKTARYDAAKARLEEVQYEISEIKAQRETIKHFIDTLKTQNGLIAEFDGDLWGSLLDHITVYAQDDVGVMFRDGTEIKV